MLFPELTLCGYPPEDLLLHRGLRSRVEAAFAKVRDEVRGIAVYVGYPEYDGDAIYNSAAMLRDGQVLANHRKVALPNYAVFDEKRYFQPGEGATVVDLGGHKLGLDHLRGRLGARRRAARRRRPAPKSILVINGSPFHTHAAAGPRASARDARAGELAAARLRQHGRRAGRARVRRRLRRRRRGKARCSSARRCSRKACTSSSSSDATAGSTPRAATATPVPPLAERVYRALVLGTRDYVEKNGFAGVVLGLSGGIDSALTLTIAVDALGADRVHAVMMPSRYTSQMSREDAALQAQAARRALRRAVDRADVRDDARRAEGRVRGAAARHDRGEHPGALPRRAADGDLEQDRARWC